MAKENELPELPDPGGPHDEAPTPEEAKEWAQRSPGFAPAGIAIPYSFPIGLATLTGLLYLKNPIRDTYTEGIIVGLTVPHTYKLDRKRAEVCADSLVVKVCVRLNLRATKLEAKVCTRRWDGSWRCSGWHTIINF